jgi:hypothetical protein
VEETSSGKTEIETIESGSLDILIVVKATFLADGLGA